MQVEKVIAVRIRVDNRVTRRELLHGETAAVTAATLRSVVRAIQAIAGITCETIATDARPGLALTNSIARALLHRVGFVIRSGEIKERRSFSARALGAIRSLPSSGAQADELWILRAHAMARAFNFPATLSHRSTTVRAVTPSSRGSSNCAIA
jgi:hypothetical protein